MTFLETLMRDGLLDCSRTRMLERIASGELHTFDDRYVWEQIRELQGSNNELVETTCKTILSDREVVFDDDADVVELVKATRKALELLPEDVRDAAKGADSIRRLLSNLATVVQGLAELRNLYGTGHGRGRSARGLGPRHARLAVGAASTLATFLFETHQERE